MVVPLAIAASILLTPEKRPLVGLELNRITDSLNFPVGGALQPGTDRIFIVERLGRVRIVEGDQVLADPALDISQKTANSSWEQGLLGIAFHPRFESDGRVFLSYTEASSGDQVVVSFRFAADKNHLDVTTETELIRVPQAYPLHNGGSIRFGPDGMLWIGLGDDGADPKATDPARQDSFRHGQNPATLPGTMVRIDVDGPAPYSIPPDNPFADGVGGAPEVWAYGLRNPWSFWFDGSTLIIGDVGFVSWEEINVLDLGTDAGANLGWSEWEGRACFADRDCIATPAMPPKIALSRNPGPCAVIVGPVYRGRAIPELVGEVFYSDLCGAWLRTSPVADLSDATPGTTWLENLTIRTTAFVTGPEGEVFVLTLDGALYRIDPVR